MDEHGGRDFSKINEIFSLRERFDPQTGRNSGFQWFDCFMHFQVAQAREYMMFTIYVSSSICDHFAPFFLEQTWDLWCVFFSPRTHDFMKDDVFFFQTSQTLEFVLVANMFLVQQTSLQWSASGQKNTKELEVKDDQFVRCDSLVVGH